MASSGVASSFQLAGHHIHASALAKLLSELTYYNRLALKDHT